METNLINIFKNIPKTSPNEIFETILKSENIKIERILSYGQTTEDNYWYDQDKDEFIIVLEGNAKIIYDTKESFELMKGDSLYIKAHQKHKVVYTSNPTIWLAIFF